MAFAASEECAYLVDAALVDYSQRNGDFVFGVIAVANGATQDVLWSNGNFNDDLPIEALDKIVPVVSSLTPGTVVRLNAALGPEYDAIIRRVYTRQPEGTGTVSAPYALIQVLSTGLFLEVLIASLTVVQGR